MYTKVIIGDNYVNFETLVSIIDLSFVKIAFTNDASKMSGEPEFHLRDIQFIKVAQIPEGILSDDYYIIRATNPWRKRIVEFINSGIAEDRPDGKEWFEEYSASYEGDPAYKYYPIGHFKELLKTALFYRGSVLEYEFDSTKLILFSKDDFKSSGSYNYVSILMNEYESQMEEQRDREEHESLEGFEDNDPDSWMDNPDDYWNID